MYARTIPIVPAAHQKDAAFEYLTTRKDELIGWARKFSIFPYPFVTACCAMEWRSSSAHRRFKPCERSCATAVSRSATSR